MKPFLSVQSTYQPCDGANFQATFSNRSASRRPGYMLLLIIFRSRSPDTRSRGKRFPKLIWNLNDYSAVDTPNAVVKADENTKTRSAMKEITRKATGCLRRVDG
jgi:hypothetical protein